MTTIEWVRGISFLAGLLTAAAVGAAPLPRYDIIDLGTLGGDKAVPAGLNDRGMVTGQSTVHVDQYGGIAFLTRKTRMIGIPLTGYRRESKGVAVNDAGTVVLSQAILFSPTIFTARGIQTISEGYGYGTAINQQGQVTGQVNAHAFVWSDPAIRDLGVVPGAVASAGLAINARADVVGWVASTPTWADRRVMTSFDGVMADLGTFGGVVAQATGVNSARRVCGTITYADGHHEAFAWQGGQFTLLGRLGDQPSSVASAINEAGDIVGMSGPTKRLYSNAKGHAFIHREGQMTKLSDLLGPDQRDVALETAVAINGLGQITGVARRNGVRFAYLATPRP